jgi:hypothetical protein
VSERDAGKTKSTNLPRRREEKCDVCNFFSFVVLSRASSSFERSSSKKISDRFSSTSGLMQKYTFFAPNRQFGMK